MKTLCPSRKRAFTLLETVIAIGVLAVLLTGFIVVFAPAAAGIKKAINVQEADRLTSAVEQELVTLRSGQQPSSATTGFAKAYEWIKSSNTATNALLAYQYRGSLSSLRGDGTPTPVPDVTGKLPGKDYAVQSMVRRKSDSMFTQDLAAVEGGLYLVKCTQLVYNGGQLKAGTAGQIADPKNSGTVSNTSDDYPEAVIAFTADFYPLPAKSTGYFTSRFSQTFANFKTPVFSRNLAVRR